MYQPLDLGRVLMVSAGHGYIAPGTRVQGQTPILVMLEGSLMLPGVVPVHHYPTLLTVDTAAQLVATIGESFRRLGLHDALQAREDRERMRAREHWQRCSADHIMRGNFDVTGETFYG